MTTRKVSGLLRATGAVLLGISTFISLNAQILPGSQSTGHRRRASRSPI